MTAATTFAESGPLYACRSSQSLADTRATDSRDAWPALLVERDHNAAEVAELPTIDLARMLNAA
ncbi:MAG: hypothetical protein HN742_15015 [Lentisphaerae bacterium]|jgi:hypothetical protein|nr:hypothetical protein [Lentisphaerota bacterium]MBT7057769.1 hypothetical protein [Lentisphaerota bacterium]MBT7843188.1 hypothetical protein [Lentisphaerota bacterium]